MFFEITKTFGPSECWSHNGGAFYPYKKNKLCKETNEKYNKMKQKFLKSKRYKRYKKDKDTKKKLSLKKAKRRTAHKKRRKSKKL